MTRYILILILVYFSNKGYGQNHSWEDDILKGVLFNAETCGKIYFTEKTDTFFINQFAGQLKGKDTWLHERGKSRIIALSKTDKLKILHELSGSKEAVWTDTNKIYNGKIIPLDSLFKVDFYVDSSCLMQLQKNDANIRVFSFSKPVFINNNNSLVMYVIEVAILPKSKKFYYWSARLMLFEKKEDKWIRLGDLYNGGGS
jgi:hypothetical protein